jgi:hypothetical protein
MLGNTGNRPLIRVLSVANGSQILFRLLCLLGILAETGASQSRIMSKKDMSNRSTEYAVRVENVYQGLLEKLWALN